MTKPDFNAKMKNWYMNNFPTDTLGLEINSDSTFSNLFDTLECYGDVYKTIGVNDSIIRERLFDGLALATGMSYEEIYDQWTR